jgi:protein TonB
MLRFAMNSPGNQDRGIGSGGGGMRRAGRLLAPACFTALALLHVAFIFVFDFFTKSERPFTKTRELFLTLDFADNGPEESAEAAQEAAQTAAREVPLPAVPLPEEEVPPLEAVSEDVPLYQGESGAESPEEPEAAVPQAASFSAPPEGVPVHPAAGVPAAPAGLVPARNNTMTDAEYLALIMSRLEKNKIYPLSVRKRGIEGDITVAFTIRRDGTVSDMRLAGPPGHRFLAQSAFETIRSAGPFPVMEGRNGDYTAQVSIRYRLEDTDPAGP